MAESTLSPHQQVILEIINGDALGIGAAARLIPANRGGGPACPSTIWRWITSGSATTEGQTVKLEAARVGGRWLTSKAALARFFVALTPDATDETPTQTKTRTASQARRSHEAAKRRLAAARR
jgi:hypothetical protein